MKPAILLLCTILSGCVTQEQIAAQRYYEAQEQEARNIAYTRHLADQCRAVGYEEGSDGFRNCMLTLHTQAQAGNAQMRSMLLQQLIQQRYNQLPPCSSLSGFNAGFARSQGSCR